MPYSLRYQTAADASYKELESAAKASYDNRMRDGRTKASKQEGLFKQVAKALRLLRNDPHHPGLCCHIFNSMRHPWDPSEKVWEAYAQNRTPGAYRIFWCYGPNRGEITIITITPHP